MNREHPPIVLENRKRSDPSETLALVGKLISLGIVKSIQPAVLRPDDPTFIHILATVGDVGRFQGPAAISAGGVATTREDAIVKAVGEAAERYCAEHYTPDEVIRASYSDLGPEAADPARFVQFHETQFAAPDFPFVKIAPADVIGWTPAFSLTNNKSILVPALAPFIGHGLAATEPRWETTDVSGYACGNTIEEAILGGLLEVIERDAFMLFWYHWLFVPGLDLTTLANPDARAALDRFGPAANRVLVSNLTTDLGVPVAFAALFADRPGLPAAVVSLASDLTLEGAVRKALVELAANSQAVRWMLEDRLRRGLPPVPTAIQTQEDHGLLYTDSRMLTYLTPVLQPYSRMSCQSKAAFDQSDIKGSIDRCVEIFRHFGHEVFVRDLTLPAVADLGLKVVKVMVPGLRPIDFAGVRHLGGDRLYSAPKRMGFPTAAQDPAALNQIPHPFL